MGGIAGGTLPQLGPGCLSLAYALQAVAIGCEMPLDRHADPLFRSCPVCDSDDLRVVPAGHPVHEPVLLIGTSDAAPDGKVVT